MKITKSQLKRIIKEELKQEGFMSAVADKLGYQKKPTSMEDQISDIMDQIKALEYWEILDQIPSGLADEVGEDGSPELRLWHAVEGVYAAFNELSRALLTSLNALE